MNRVGAEGKGESVWLGWFLHATLCAFAPLAESRGEQARATAWRQHADGLRKSLEREGWDGDWYRRGYFDDGTPLGSASSDECRIDSIAQSWGVISGAADPVRSASAMAAVDEHLVRRGDGLVLLFTPPFDRTSLDPGYIKGYPPGIRENGGQYTHAAIWSVLAFAMLGDGDKAAELFSILNPIHHASTRAAVHRYKVEPYVACADVYSRAAARRPRRLDLVHRLGRMDVSGGPRVDPRLPPARRDARPRSMRAEGLARASRSPSATAPRATRSRSRIRAGSAEASRAWSSTARRCRETERRSPWPTTGRRIGCASSSDERARGVAAAGFSARRATQRCVPPCPDASKRSRRRSPPRPASAT